MKINCVRSPAKLGDAVPVLLALRLDSGQRFQKPFNVRFVVESSPFSK